MAFGLLTSAFHARGNIFHAGMVDEKCYTNKL